jgi:hypothetical protein
MKPIQRRNRRGRALIAVSSIGLLATSACGDDSFGIINGVVPCQIDAGNSCAEAPDGGDAGTGDAGLDGGFFGVGIPSKDGG